MIKTTTIKQRSITNKRILRLLNSLVRETHIFVEKQKIKIFLLLWLMFFVVFTGCFTPYGYFETNRPSKCMYFNTEKFQIEEKCPEQKNEKIIISSLNVAVFYDTIHIVDGKPTDRYMIFEKKGNIVFPFSLDTIFKYRLNSIEISLRTNISTISFAVHLNRADWNKGLIPFTYYYNK
jgi:hypothetical protein